MSATSHKHFPRRPADFRDIDVSQVRTVLNDPAVKYGCELAGVEFPVFQQFEAAVARAIIDGSAKRGVRIDALARAQGVPTNIRAHLDSNWETAGDLVARLLHHAPKGQLLCERISSHVVKTGRDNHGLGRFEKHGAGNSLKMIGLSSGRVDRHIRTYEMSLTTGTQDDRHAPVADHERIAQFAQIRGHEIPGSVPEHVEHLLRRRCRLQTQVKRGSPPSVSVRVEQLFADWVVVDAINYGLPLSRGRKWSATAFPGAERAFAQAFADTHSTGVLFAGPDPEPVIPLDLRDYEPVHEQTPVSQTPLWGVEYWYHQGQGLLARQSTQQLGRGAGRQLWRVINPAKLPLAGAITAIEHELEAVPVECLYRHCADGAPGMISAQEHEPALVASIVAADAVCVEAERRRHARGSRPALDRH